MDEGKYLEPALPEFFSGRVQGYGLMKIWRGGVATNKERLLPRRREGEAAGRRRDEQGATLATPACQNIFAHEGS